MIAVVAKTLTVQKWLSGQDGKEAQEASTKERIVGK